MLVTKVRVFYRVRKIFFYLLFIYLKCSLFIFSSELEWAFKAILYAVLAPCIIDNFALICFDAQIFICHKTVMTLTNFNLQLIALFRFPLTIMVVELFDVEILEFVCKKCVGD